MDSLSSIIQESSQHQLISTLLSHPSFKQLLHKEILEFSEHHRLVQLGTGIPKLINEIYESVDTIVGMKVKEGVDREGVSWMEEGARIRREVEEVRGEVREFGRREREKEKEKQKEKERGERIDTARSFELDKLMQDRSSIMQGVAMVGTGEVQCIRREIQQIRGKLQSFMTIDKQRHTLERQIFHDFSFQPHPQSPSNNPSKSNDRKRNHTGSQLLSPSLKKPFFPLPLSTKQFDQVIDSTLTQKFSTYQNTLTTRYDTKIDEILKSLRFLEGTIAAQKQQREEKDMENEMRQVRSEIHQGRGFEKKEINKLDLADVGMLRMDSDRSFYSKRSTKTTGFASRLVWK